MQVRVYSSLTAHDQDDARFWAALPVEERVLQVWKLSEAQWRLRGDRVVAVGYRKFRISMRSSPAAGLVPPYKIVFRSGETPSPLLARDSNR